MEKQVLDVLEIANSLRSREEDNRDFVFRLINICAIAGMVVICLAQALMLVLS